MSGLIDMWAQEVSKVKEKGHGSSNHMEVEYGHYAQKQQKENMRSSALAVATGKFNHLNNKPMLLFSEESVSLLVTCFSP